MPINITEEVQKRLLFPPLQNVDPNDQPKKRLTMNSNTPVSQAAVVTALAGLYKTTRTDSDCEKLLSTERRVTWLEDVYGDNFMTVIKRIGEYCKADIAEVVKLIKLAADVSIKIIA